MANPSGRITCSMLIVPEETVASTTQSSIWSNIYTRQNILCPIFNNEFSSESITFSNTGKSSFGYLNGERYLAQITTTSTAAIGTGISQIEYAWFAHTGYRFSSEADATCDITNTDATVTCDSSDFIAIGMEVTGTDIDAGTTVASINTGTERVNVTSFELSAAAGATATNRTLTFYDHVLTSTTVSTDHLEIRGGADDGFVIAVLAPGNSIILPVQSSAGWTTTADEIASSDYFFQSVDPADLSAGGNDIAMQFFCATHA